MPVRTFTLRLNDRQYRHLELLAQHYDMKKQDIARQAIREKAERDLTKEQLQQAAKAAARK